MLQRADALLVTPERRRNAPYEAMRCGKPILGFLPVLVELLVELVDLIRKSVDAFVDATDTLFHLVEAVAHFGGKRKPMTAYRIGDFCRILRSA